MRITGNVMEKALADIEIFISTDLETTGFSVTKGAEILEIGAVMINPKTKKILKTFNRLVKPRNSKISAKITEVTNITNDMILDKEYIEPVLRDFNEFIGEYPLVFHNACFDWDRFLEPLFKKQGIIKSNQIIDTLPLTKICIPDIKEKNLGSVCKYFGYEIKNQHRALSDAKATGALAIRYKEILKKKHSMNNEYQENSYKKSESSLPDFNIKSINCWEKSRNRRIYILSSWGNLYYDLDKCEWFVANAFYDVSLNFKVVQDKFLTSCKLATTDDIEDYFNQKVKEKAS